MINIQDVDAQQILIETGYVPVIDLTLARHGSAAHHSMTAELIDRTCKNSGFFVITGHGIPQEAIDNLYHSAQQFFTSPLEYKNTFACDPRDVFTRGYHCGGSLAASNDDIDHYAAHQNPDLVERFIYNPMGESDAQSRYNWPTSDNPAADEDDLLWLPNKWPDVANFRTHYLRYMDLLTELASELLSLFAVALQLPSNWFDKTTDQHASQAIINYYPAQDKKPLAGQMRLGRHTDWGSFTLLFHDDNGSGLQVLTKDHQWMDVPHIRGSYVVNIGDLMARWTNDRWVSTMHRVRNPTPEISSIPRMSIPFFHQPNHDVIISCIPSCVDSEHPAKYTPVFLVRI